MPTKEKLQHLFRLFKKRDRVAILIVPDPDAIASAMALQAILKPRTAHIDTIHIGETRRPDNQTMLRLLRLRHLYLRQTDLTWYSKLVMLDGQPSHNPATGSLKITAVIDHHPDEHDPSIPFRDIRPSYGATATILTEYLIEAGIPITPRLATALYYAIKTDTDMFRRISNDKDLNVLSHLLPRIKVETLRIIEGSEILRKQLKYFIKALQEVTFSHTMAYVHLGIIERSEFSAVIADFLLRVRGTYWSIVSQLHQKCVIITMRSWKERKDVGKIATRAFQKFGRAGGHRFASRAEVPLKNIPPEYLPATDEAIKRFIMDRVLLHHKAGAKNNKHLKEEMRFLDIDPS
ncbi:MAG: DHH family phosphoesterase [Candidatus Eremiobacteraeota bacterium]|nr:DHH family phosphoesterase [Candidatus Eremiobacteraeota bacterium]